MVMIVERGAVTGLRTGREEKNIRENFPQYHLTITDPT
jgi:hypothetical protein